MREKHRKIETDVGPIDLPVAHRRLWPRQPLAAAVLDCSALGLVGLACVVTFIGMSGSGSTMRIGAWAPLPPIAIVVAIGMHVVATRLRKRLKKLALRHDGLLCLDCHYPLEGLGDIRRCPECDESYDPAWVQRVWRRWVPNLPVQ